MTASLWAALGAFGSAVAPVIWAWASGRVHGRQQAEREQLRERVRGAEERANADRDASHGDARDRLREDWQRGV